MKLNSTTFRIQAIISLVLIFISTNFLFSQTQEWIRFTSGKDISCLAEEGEYLWVGTAGGWLVKLNKSTGEFIVYDKWNSKLPHNWVTTIAIDRQGNKWIGTESYWSGSNYVGGGLAKFDGVNWTVYNTENSGLPSNYVNAIAIDAQGNKWIGTEYGGLAMFDGVKWTIYNTSNSGLPSDYVRAIAIDAQGNKWIGTESYWNGSNYVGGGLAKFDGVNWTVYNTENSGLPNNGINAIAIDAQGNKWIGTYKGLAKFDGVNWTVYNTENSGLPSNYVRAIAIDAQGNKWIGTESYWNGSNAVGGGLAKFDGVKWTVYNTSNSGLPGNNVWAIAIDGQGNKWIGTSGGVLAKFDGVKWTIYNTSNSGLPGDCVSAIAIDGQGNKWIGNGDPFFRNFGGGLAKFDGVKWTVYNTSNSGLPSDFVYAIAIDAQGNKWIGTFWGGLAKFDGVNWTVYNTENSGLPSNYVYVYAIAIDGQGNKWIGTIGGGLAKFDGVKWTVYNTKNSGFPDNDVTSIAIDGQGNKWIGTYGGGLVKFVDLSWTVHSILIYDLDYVTAIAIDGQGNKWIGILGLGGFAKFDDMSWTVYNPWNSGLPGYRVNAIAIDGQGNKWIGTEKGLAMFDGVNWTVYNTENSGLPDDDVWAIAIDAQGNKWIGTCDGGLAVYREGGVILSDQKFTLYQNYPNPFYPATTIEFEILERTNVKLVVYDFLGNEIETLIDRELEAGNYKLNFESNGLPSGVYLYTLKTPKSIQTNKMLLIK